MIWTGSQLQEALGVRVDPTLRTGVVQFNSKDVKIGDLFIAISGLTDGHKYVREAIELGAASVIIEKAISNIDNTKTIVVEDTKLALKQLGDYKRSISKAKFIAVTGSVGKTSAKEALKIMFEAYGKTFASRGNFNNDLGVAINLASMACDVEYAIFEIGMNHAGEIRKLTNVIKPDVAMITAVSAAHLEFFSSVEAIVDAKCEIFEGMQDDAVAIINSDSVYFNQMIKSIKQTNVKKIYTFGASKLADLSLIDYTINSGKTQITYDINDNKILVEMPYIFPVHQAENLAGCFSVIVSLGLDITKAAEAIKEFTLDMGRGKIINFRKSSNQFQVICDYYNSNPASLIASLKFFKQIAHPDKIAIIGDMRELGPASPTLHAELVPFIIDSGATKIILVGEQVKFINDLLPKKLYTKQFDNVDMLMQALGAILQNGNLILIKGSRGVSLEKVLEYFDKD